MDPGNLECDLQSLRRLYGLLQSNANNESIPQPFLLDLNTQFLLKRLLDSATNELLDRQTKILAQVQLNLPEKVSTPIKESSLSRGTIKLSSRSRLTEEVVDSIERIDTQLSAFRFCSSRVVSHDNDHRTWLRETTLTENRQRFQDSMPCGLRNSYLPMTQTPNNATKATFRSRDDRDLHLQSQGSCSPDDQFIYGRSRPPRPVRSVGFKKPCQSNRTSSKMLSIKPTLLDQESESWDEGSIENESESTRSRTSSGEDEEQFSLDQESEEASDETGSASVSSWETKEESVTKSNSSYSQHSNDDDDDEDSEESDSPPHRRRDRSNGFPKQRKKAMGRIKRFKNKLGQVFHHHHHHFHMPSAWKHLQSTFQQKDKEKPESRGLTTRKRKGGQFQALVEGLMRHKKHSKKQKHKLFQRHGKKTHWWQTSKRKGGVKFPNKSRVKLPKRNYLCDKDQEFEEN